MDPLIDVDFTDIPEGEGTGLIEETHDEIMMASGDVLGSFEDTYPKLMIPKHDRKVRKRATCRSLRDECLPRNRSNINVRRDDQRWNETDRFDRRTSSFNSRKRCQVRRNTRSS